MSALKLRYILRRADGMFFHQPTDEDLREWRPTSHTAHQWVDLGAAKAAAYLWQHLKAEEVEVTTHEVPLTLPV